MGSGHPILTSLHLASPRLASPPALESSVGRSDQSTCWTDCFADQQDFLTNGDPSHAGSTAEIEQVCRSWPVAPKSGCRDTHLHNLTSVRTHYRSGARDLKMRPGQLSPETQTTRSFNHQEALRRLVLGQGRIQMRSARDWPVSPPPVSFHSHLRPGLAGSACHAETSWARRPSPAEDAWHAPVQADRPGSLCYSTYSTHAAHSRPSTCTVSSVQGSMAPTVMLAVPPCRIKAGVDPPVGPEDECRLSVAMRECCAARRSTTIPRLGMVDPKHVTSLMCWS